MDNLDKMNEISYAALNKRMNVLENYGHISNLKENQILILVWINNFINRYEGILTGYDLNIIESVISCIMRSNCLVNYMLIERSWYSYQYNVSNSRTIRITEDSIQRITEVGQLRNIE